MPRCQFASRIPEMVNHLKSVYWRKTAADVALGSRWYPDARRIVHEWAETFNQSPLIVANVVAALSPQVDWPRNLISADDVLNHRPLTIHGLQHTERKARYILDHAVTDIRDVMPHGPKVFNFAQNLVGYSLLGLVPAVTIDTHAMQAALDDVTATYTLPWTPYECFATAYRLAASQFRIEPDTFQAVIWHIWKREHPPEQKRKERRRW